MYSHEDKMRAIELCLRYDRSAAAVVNELSYPNRHILRLRHMELEENGDLGRGRRRRCDDFQKRVAVGRFVFVNHQTGISLCRFSTLR